jgi:hypothetical protein
MVAYAAIQLPLIALSPGGGPPSCGTWLVDGLPAAARGVRGLGAVEQGGRGGQKQWHYTLCLLRGSCIPHGED